MVKMALTGTIIPTIEDSSAGTKMNSTSISKMGAMAIFQFLEIKATPKPPKRAGRICWKAGCSAGAERLGVRGMIRTTPKMMIKVVTMLEVAMAMVEITSPSSLLALTSFCSKDTPKLVTLVFASLILLLMTVMPQGKYG